MPRSLSSFVVVLAASAAAAQAPAPTVPAHTVSLRGCVAKEGTLQAGGTAGLVPVRRLVKLASASGGYRCTVEVEGVTLKDVLDRAEVRKKTDDGFPRPLDTFIVVRGASGAVVLSWGEVFLTADGGPILAERARLVFPHHHPKLEAGSFDPEAWMDVARRDGPVGTGCASCHDGTKQIALAPPKGWFLVVPADGFGGRFVEDAGEVSVQQVGITVADTREAAKSIVVEVPEVVGLDGAKTQLTPARLEKEPRIERRATTFGLGRGFHGVHVSRGVDLAALLSPLLPAGTDPRSLWVLVTAADGYRSLFSGQEVLAATPGHGVLLADAEDGTPLGAGAGRYRVVSMDDFFVDRSVRQVKEIRLGVVR